MNLRFNYPKWIDNKQWQTAFEERATELLARKPDGRYNIYLPYYEYTFGNRVCNAPRELFIGQHLMVPDVVIIHESELSIGCTAAKVGEVIVSHRHVCPRCDHCILDHTILSWPKAEQWVPEWHVCHCGCAFYTEEVFAPYDHRKKS